MGLNRRDFLTQTGGLLAALGAGDLSLLSRYHQVLAEPTRRKLALLVGINQYRSDPLSGCVTDVELQRELLIHRFGFQPQDILTLTDQQATREAIASAFTIHLAEQAKPGDVVVFHFSGYGGTITASPEVVQPSLVPVDGLVSGEAAIANDLLEDTLWLLVRSLQTSKVTTLLDTSHTYPGKPLQGNLRIRSRPIRTPLQPDPAELALQQALITKLSPRLPVSPSPHLPVSSSPHPPFPGILLTAAAPQQLATEVRWNGFSAGLFTYSLTRHLWQATPATTLRVILSRTKMQVEQVASQEQQPQLAGQKSQEQPLQPYGLPLTSPTADGVVLAVEDNGKIAQLWLGGLSATLLEQYGVNSLLALVDSNLTNPPTYLQLLSRDGLTAKAKINLAGAEPEALAPAPLVQVGQFVRERVRVLPRSVGLTVALDSSLERIERVDAISAFTAVPRVSSAIAGEQPADYLFSKIQTPAPTQVASAAPVTGVIANPAQSSYGLFSLGQDAIPNTAGEGGEAVKFAVRRLVPKLQTLLAAKLLNLTVNDTASQLAVRMTLERLDPQPQTLLRRETQAIAQTAKDTPPTPAETRGLLTLPIGSRIQYRLENRSTQSLHTVLLSMDSAGNLSFFHTPTATPPGTPASVPLTLTLAPGEVLTLPPPVTSFQWTLSGPIGLTETYLICSRTPFTLTQGLLEATLHPTGSTPAFYPLPNPLDVAQAVLQDLHQASDTAAVGIPADSYALDVNVWASLRFVYQIV